MIDAPNSAADVARLLEILDDHERYAVGPVRRRRARLFTLFLGEIEEMDSAIHLGWDIEQAR